MTGERREGGEKEGRKFCLGKNLTPSPLPWHPPPPPPPQEAELLTAMQNSFGAPVMGSPATATADLDVVQISLAPDGTLVETPIGDMNIVLTPTVGALTPVTNARRRRSAPAPMPAIHSRSRRGIGISLGSNTVSQVW